MPKYLNLKKNVKIWCFQHPKEEKRSLRTTRILEKCLDEENFEILKSRRFNENKYELLIRRLNYPKLLRSTPWSKKT